MAGLTSHSFGGLTLPSVLPFKNFHQYSYNIPSSITVDGINDSLPLPSSISIFVRKDGTIVIKKTNGMILYVIQTKCTEKHSFELQNYNSRL